MLILDVELEQGYIMTYIVISWLVILTYDDGRKVMVITHMVSRA